MYFEIQRFLYCLLKWVELSACEICFGALWQQLMVIEFPDMYKDMALACNALLKCSNFPKVIFSISLSHKSVSFEKSKN